MIEIEPIGPETCAIARIAVLADERRRLLRTGSPRQSVAGHLARLQEIDRELERLWGQRRQELARPVTRSGDVGAGEQTSPSSGDGPTDDERDTGQHSDGSDGIRSLRWLGQQD